MSNLARQRDSGFSLTEVMLAVGTLAVGMIFIGGTFMAGILLTTVSSERTTAATAAEEALAKVRLYGIDLNDRNLFFNRNAFFETVSQYPVDPNELTYPSTRTLADKQYFWSGLCRRSGASSVEVTIFISRKVGSGSMYWMRDSIFQPGLLQYPVPRPVLVPVLQHPLRHKSDELQIAVPAGSPEERFIKGGSVILDDRTGRIYQVLERYDNTAPDTIIRLKSRWVGLATGWVWVVPPPVAGGRAPCIAVYQKEMRF